MQGSLLFLLSALVALMPGLGFFAMLSSASAPSPVAEHAVVIFGGDMMFDRTIRAAIDQKGGDFIFSCIDDTLQRSDMVVANLEGPITATSSTSVGSPIGAPDNFTFTFAPSTAALLYAHHVGLVNLGNNHIENFGIAGVRSTIAFLSQAGVGYFGDPLSDTVSRGELKGVKVAFIGYNEFIDHAQAASTTIAQIKTARAGGYLPIVYTHWGIEYATTSPLSVQALAHEFVDAGAEIVIGSHPHVVEEHEIYKGKYIYYSLGNFIFDQYFSDAVDHGLLLSVDITSAGVQSVTEIPIELDHDRRTCPTP